jgi:hypothetical protein
MVPLTANDGIDYPLAKGLYVLGDGVIRVTTQTGNVRNIPVKDGSLLPLQTTRLHASGTAGVTSVFAVY